LTNHFEILHATNLDEETLISDISRAQVIFAQKLPKNLLKAAVNLRLIQTPGTGVDKLELGVLAQRNIQVANSHSAAAYVAEHAVAMLLDLMKKISLQDRRLREGNWYAPRKLGEESYLQSDHLSGKTIGLVGFGHVGRAIGELLQGFDVTCLAHTRRKSIDKKSGLPHPEILDLKDVLSRSDAVFVSLPLTDETNLLIGETELANMKRNSYLINVGRAEVIDQSALLAVLRKDEIRGAGLDVWWDGLTSVKKFADFDHKIVLSPHRAGTDRDVSPNLGGVIASLRQFAKTGNSKNIVDAKAGY
jgi:phosphoglycerate dehydrogenase-like enzyme